MNPKTDGHGEAGQLPDALQILVLLASVYVLASLLLRFVLRVDPQVVWLLEAFDAGACALFLTEFFLRLHRAPRKLAFLKWGWIDLVSSIPFVPELRWGRVVRVVRIVQLLRAMRSARALLGFLYANRARSSILAVASMMVVLVVFASVAILSFEGASGNIHSAIDALWWAFSTISTTGSGDKYPITAEGKVLSIVLAVGGIGIFGTFTAFVSKLFIEPEQRREGEEIGHLRTEIAQLREQISEMKSLLEERR